MNNKEMRTKITLIIAALAVLFIGTAIFTAARTYRSNLANEKFEIIDIQSMHKFSEGNSARVFKALKSGKTEELEKLMDNSEGLDKVVGFADWTAIDMEKVSSMGSGTLSAEADADGKIDVSERFIVELGDSRYVFFIETLTSRWGRRNEGISAVSVTSFDHFDDMGYAWCGESDDSSACAGKLFWPGNQPAESQKP